MGSFPEGDDVGRSRRRCRGAGRPYVAHWSNWRPMARTESTLSNYLASASGSSSLLASAYFYCILASPTIAASNGMQICHL